MPDSTEREVLSISTTVGSQAAAQTLAREILASRLAACIQIDPEITSFYRWQGKLCEELELRLIIKTLPGCEGALQALFAKHHPYEVPQFLVSRMSASPGYRQWMAGEVKLPQAGGS